MAKNKVILKKWKLFFKVFTNLKEIFTLFITGILIFTNWAVWLYGFIPTNRTHLAPSTIKMAKKAFAKKEILGVFPEGDTLSDELRSAKPGAVFLSTLGQVPIVQMSIYGLKKGLWDYIFSGIRPKISIRVGKPFGPFELPQT